jgi:hypothetical protein
MNNNFNLMSNRFIELRSVIENNFNSIFDLMIPRETIKSLMLLPNRIMNNQKKILISLLNELNKSFDSSIVLKDLKETNKELNKIK